MTKVRGPHPTDRYHVRNAVLTPKGGNGIWSRHRTWLGARYTLREIEAYRFNGCTPDKPHYLLPEGGLTIIRLPRRGNDWAWIVPALRQRCRCEQNWALPGYVRWWVTARTVLALALGREHWWDRTARAREGIGAEDHIEVAVGGVHSTFHPDFGSGGEFDYLAAPRHGFGYSIGHTGWP